MADNLQIHVRTFQPATTQEQALETLTDSMAEVLDERQLRHIKNAVLLREETQTTYLDHGLAVPHGRTSALDSMSAQRLFNDCRCFFRITFRTGKMWQG